MTTTSPSSVPLFPGAAPDLGHAGPLAGLVVLDLGQAAVAPLAATYLGMLGALVIKVESPRGDMVRRGEPTMLGTSTTFIGNNWGKYAIRLDLKAEEGKEALADLIRRADLLIENFRNPQVLPKLDFDSARLAELNPNLVYVESSAFGDAPPELDTMISNEWITEALGGLVSVTGSQSRAEFMRGTSLLDWSGAMVNTVVALAGLLQARTSGGMTLRTSQLGSTVFAGLTRFVEAQASGVAPTPAGSAGSYFAPDGAFATSDGWLGLCAPTQRMWQRLCGVLDLPELPGMPQFADNPARVEHRHELTRALEARLKEKPASEWAAMLAGAGVPHTLYPRERWLSDQLAIDPQVAWGGHLLGLPSPWGLARTSAPHWKFSRTPARISRPSPTFSEHQAQLPDFRRLSPRESGNVMQPAPSADRLLPLGDVTVVEVSTGLCAPLGGRVLAELGATVHRVEPSDGDWVRLASRGDGATTELFDAANAGKQLHRLDVTSADGRKELDRLINGADVLVTSLSPAAQQAAGLDEGTLASSRPELVRIRVSGWGASGPKAGQGATELDMQAAVSMYRHVGSDDAEPVRVGFDLVTVNTGLAMAQATLAALLERGVSGEGQAVDVSMLATAIAISQWTITAESRPDRVRGIQLEGYELPPDLGVLCADGRSCRLDFRKRHQLWSELLHELGRGELAQDPRYADEQSVNLNRPTINADLTDALEADGWDYPRLARFVGEGGGTIAPALTIPEIMAYPQVDALGIVDASYPGLVRLPYLASYATVPTQK
jgi:formyl-CoA transferase